MEEFFKEILANINKESRLGYSDTAVFGGFYSYVAGKLTAVSSHYKDEILQLLKEYDTAPLWRRKEILSQCSLLLKDLSAALPREDYVSVTADSLPGSQEISLRYLKGVGAKRVALLKKLGIEDIWDLIEYFPKRHEDRGDIKSIADLASGEYAVIKGKIAKAETIRLKKKLDITKVLLTDDSGVITAVWFNQPWLKDKLHIEDEIVLYGKSDFRYGKKQFAVVDFVLSPADSGFGILPVYGLTQGISQKLMRSIIENALSVSEGKIPEFLPDSIRQTYNLAEREWSIFHYHFPDDIDELREARRRVVFDELFLLRLASSMVKGTDDYQGIEQKKGTLAEFSSLLPYKLTKAQIRSIEEIYNDMSSAVRMTRLLEGDVGSGKTTVAAAAIYRSWCSGFQSTLMAPTEILALQHYSSLKKIFASLDLNLALLTGNTQAGEKKEIYKKLTAGEIDCLIGTHALIEDKTHFKNLATVIIDEQHRFGVAQREKLAAKGLGADTLVLTATPIPRTLAMTVFADLSISLLDEQPPGRQEIKTFVLDPKEEMRALNFIKEQAKQGHQSFIVCPLVDESETVDLAAATDLYDRLRQGLFRDIKVGLIHGKMKAADKEKIMREFHNGEIDVLVSTTVVEVGVDVPNATVMLIRDAHRFGLAQLHQMRGRIGRGEAQSYCVLEYAGQGETAKKRMDVMVKYNDGFKIAEEDLSIRGPGDFFGTRQHGIAELKVADLYVDHQILASAAECASGLLRHNPSLEGEEWRNLRCLLRLKKRMF